MERCTSVLLTKKQGDMKFILSPCHFHLRPGIIEHVLEDVQGFPTSF
jgi:hypothetical protein